MLNVKPGPGVEPSSLILRKSDLIMPVPRACKAPPAPGKYEVGSTHPAARQEERWVDACDPAGPRGLRGAVVPTETGQGRAVSAPALTLCSSL